MPNEITDAAAHSAKATKSLDTRRATARSPRPRPPTATRPRRGMHWRPMPPHKLASVATAQRWPTARAARSHLGPVAGRTSTSATGTGHCLTSHPGPQIGQPRAWNWSGFDWGCSLGAGD